MNQHASICGRASYQDVDMSKSKLREIINGIGFEYPERIYGSTDWLLRQEGLARVPKDAPKYGGAWLVRAGRTECPRKGKLIAWAAAAIPDDGAMADNDDDLSVQSVPGLADRADASEADAKCFTKDGRPPGSGVASSNEPCSAEASNGDAENDDIRVRFCWAVDNSSGEVFEACTCGIEKHTSGPESEMDKFDDMISLLHEHHGESFRQVVAMDEAGEALKRAWVVAEVAEVFRRGICMKMKVHFPETPSLRRSVQSLDVRECEASVAQDKKNILAKILDKDLYNKQVRKVLMQALLNKWVEWVSYVTLMIFVSLCLCLFFVIVGSCVMVLFSSLLYRRAAPSPDDWQVELPRYSLIFALGYISVVPLVFYRHLLYGLGKLCDPGVFHDVLDEIPWDYRHSIFNWPVMKLLRTSNCSLFGYCGQLKGIVRISILQMLLLGTAVGLFFIPNPWKD